MWLYLVILVLYSKMLSQVSKHLWAVVFEFELSWKVFSEEQTSLNTLNHNNATWELVSVITSGQIMHHLRQSDKIFAFFLEHEL